MAPSSFFEHGPVVEALTGVLNQYMRQFPNDKLLKNWVDNALAGAEHTYLKANLPVGFQFTILMWILKFCH